MTITTTAPNRKELVRAIAAHTNTDAVYEGPPSFAYRVGNITIDRNGNVSAEDGSDLSGIRRMLVEKGYAEDEPETLEIHVPTENMDAAALTNLVFLLKSKQYLLNRVTRHTTFGIPDELAQALGAERPETPEAFMERYSQYETKGLTFTTTDVSFSFPLDADGAKNRAYAEVAAFMVKAAQEATRISWAERKPENEKYYLRCWLIRLGLNGMGAKESRKALLAGLNGHVAFKTKEAEERHKAKQAAKRAEARAAAAEATEAAEEATEDAAETSDEVPEKLENI